jgi:hypothetical protein
MFEAFRIREHMEIANHKGDHVGTVDSVTDDRIELTRSHNMDDQHHFLSMEDIGRLADNRVYLKKGAPLPAGLGNKANRA